MLIYELCCICTFVHIVCCLCSTRCDSWVMIQPLEDNMRLCEYNHTIMLRWRTMFMKLYESFQHLLWPVLFNNLICEVKCMLWAGMIQKIIKKNIFVNTRINNQPLFVLEDKIKKKWPDPGAVITFKHQTDGRDKGGDPVIHNFAVYTLHYLTWCIAEEGFFKKCQLWFFWLKGIFSSIGFVCSCWATFKIFYHLKMVLLAGSDALN